MASISSTPVPARARPATPALLAAVLVLASVPTGLAAQEHVPAAALDGAWQVSFDSHMGQLEWDLELVVEEGRISGVADTPVGPASVEGTQQDDELEFTLFVEAPDHAVEMRFTGTIEGDEASGFVEIMGEQFAWSAVRL